MYSRREVETEAQRKLNAPFLNYGNAERQSAREYAADVAQAVNRGIFSYSNSQDSCCLDTWRNVFAGAEGKQLGRECTTTEQHQLSMRKVFAKQFISLILVAIIGVYFVLTVPQDRGNIFDCDATSETGIIAIDEALDNFKGNVFLAELYCYFKFAMIMLSFVFLIPFVMETISLLTILWVSVINDDVLIPVADGSYAGYGPLFDSVMSPNPFKRIIACFGSIFYLPYLIIQTAKNSDANMWLTTLFFEIWWKFFVFLLPDLLVALLLFPVSYFVMQSSRSPDELLVNLVAVQVFAQLDEMVVKMVFRPRVSIGDAMENYLGENVKALQPVYRPLEAFVLNANRHEMGFKTSSPEYRRKMGQFHDYSGFPLV